MTYSAFANEISALVGALKLTFINGEHTHLVGPLSPALKQGLIEECEDSVFADPGLAPIVVRRTLGVAQLGSMASKSTCGATW